MSVPELPPITDAMLWDILDDRLSDEGAMALVWQAIGYVRDPETGVWSGSQADPHWRDEYPTPPNFIESRPATVKLTRSIPAEHKQLLKEELKFKGYPIGQLIPRLTRRATIVSWLLAYRRR